MRDSLCPWAGGSRRVRRQVRSQAARRRAPRGRRQGPSRCEGAWSFSGDFLFEKYRMIETMGEMAGCPYDDSTPNESERSKSISKPGVGSGAGEVAAHARLRLGFERGRGGLCSRNVTARSRGACTNIASDGYQQLQAAPPMRNNKTRARGAVELRARVLGAPRGSNTACHRHHPLDAATAKRQHS